MEDGDAPLASLGGPTDPLREIQASIAKRARAVAPRLATTASSAVLVALSSAALAPVVLPVFAGTVSAAAAMALLGGLGQNLLASVLHDWSAGIRRGAAEAGGGAVADLDGIIERRLAMPATQRETRRDLSVFLRSVGAVDVALDALAPSARIELSAVFGRCAADYKEFAWMVRDVQRSLGELSMSMAELSALVRAHLSATTMQVSQVARAPELSVRPPAGEPAANPYLGLRSYGAADAHLFFGRRALVAQLGGRLLEAPFLAVVGASGSGKTSVVRAGLIPMIWRGDLPGGGAWRTRLVDPGLSPLGSLAAALGAAPGDVARSPGALVHAVRVTLTEMSNDAQHLLVIDPFEAVLAASVAEPERSAFVQAIIKLSLLERSRVVIVLRADVYERCLGLAGLSDLLERHQLIVPPMRDDELREAIEAPPRMVGRPVSDPGLTALIVREVRSEPGALPLMSHALAAAWDHAGGMGLTLAAYEETGGVRHAIAQTAEQSYSRLDADGQTVCRQLIMSRLIAVSADDAVVRRAVSRAELDDLGDGRLNTVVEHLAAARLLVVDDHTVRIAHEALLREWPRLRAWLDEHAADDRIHRALTRAAAEWWSDARDASLLLTGRRLAETTEWVTQHEPPLTPTERAFLADSNASMVAAIRARERQVRLLRALVMVLVLLAAGGATLAWTARREQQRANDKAAEALSRQLSIQATSMIERDPDVAQLVALEAYRIKSTLDARSAVLASIESRPQLLTSLHGDLRRECLCSEAVAYSPDGRLMASADLAAVRVWRTSDRQLLTIIPGRRTEVRALAFDRTSSRLAIGDLDGLRVVDTRTWAALLDVDRGVSTGGVAFTPDGRTVVASGADNRVVFWSVTSRQRTASLRAGGKNTDRLAISPTGDMLAVVSAGVVRVWELPSRKLLGDIHSQFTRDVVFANDLVLFSGFDTIGMWNPYTRRLHASVSVGSPVDSMARSPETGQVAVGLDDGRIRFLDADQLRLQPATLRASASQVQAIAYDPIRAELASTDDALRLWALGSRTELTGRIETQATVTAVAFTSDSKTLISADLDRVSTYRTADHAVLASVPIHQLIADFALIPGTRRVVAITNGGQVLTIDLDRRSAGNPSAAPRGYPAAIAISPDGRTTAMMAGRMVTVVSAQHHQTYNVADDVRDVAFSRDGRLLAVAALDGIRIWDVHTGRYVTGLPSGVITSLTFGHDEDTLVAGSVDTIQVWNVATRKEVEPLLRGHVGIVSGLAVTPDGKTLASVGEDGTVRLWDLTQGREIGAALPTDDHQADSVAFSPDGQTLATAGGSTGIRLWSRLLWTDKLHELTAITCEVVGRSLTQAEWRDALRALPYRRTCG